MLLIFFFFFCSSTLLARCVRPQIQIRSEIAHVPPFSSLLVVQLKFPTMMSSLFQTSRLKTVSKRFPIASFPCACVRVVVSAWPPDAIYTLPCAFLGVFVQPALGLWGNPTVDISGVCASQFIAICGSNGCPVSPSPCMNECRPDRGRKTDTSPPRCLEAENLTG